MGTCNSFFFSGLLFLGNRPLLLVYSLVVLQPRIPLYLLHMRASTNDFLELRMSHRGQEAIALGWCSRAGVDSCFVQ